MLTGTVILAFQNQSLRCGVERMICGRHPAVHIEQAVRGEETIRMQSMIRAAAIFMDMNQPDMTGDHLLCELRRDIARPFILVCSPDQSAQAKRRAMRLGANSYITMPADITLLCSELEAQLEKRVGTGSSVDVYLAEAMLQRIFMERGIPFELKGYSYLKYAVGLVLEGEASVDSMQALYERVGEKFHCAPASVEKNIRYAISQGEERAREEYPDGKLTNRQFIARILAEYQSPKQTMLKPRVSVFTSARRVFR